MRRVPIDRMAILRYSQRQMAGLPVDQQKPTARSTIIAHEAVLTKFDFSFMKPDAHMSPFDHVQAHIQQPVITRPKSRGTGMPEHMFEPISPTRTASENARMYVALTNSFSTNSRVVGNCGGFMTIESRAPVKLDHRDFMNPSLNSLVQAILDEYNADHAYQKRVVPFAYLIGLLLSAAYTTDQRLNVIQRKSKFLKTDEIFVIEHAHGSIRFTFRMLAHQFSIEAYDRSRVLVAETITKLPKKDGPTRVGL